MSAGKAAAIIRIMGGPHPDPRFVEYVTERISRSVRRDAASQPLPADTRRKQT